jgi:hypothetical protein
MSRLTDLIAQAKAKDPQIGADLEREFNALSSLLSFGLNFERHKAIEGAAGARALYEGLLRRRSGGGLRQIGAVTAALSRNSSTTSIE